jgi:hypothetical protein
VDGRSESVFVKKQAKVFLSYAPDDRELARSEISRRVDAALEESEKAAL